MIITLKGADFSTSNIGTLSTWNITRVLGDGATYDGVTYVDRDAAFNATVTIAEGYELGAAGVTVTMGGEALDSGITVNENIITIAIDSVTGNVKITVPTINISTGEEDNGSVSGIAINTLIRTTSNDYAQSLPTGTTTESNLWSVLTPEKKYYDASGNYVAYQKVASIIFPVLEGDKITASSFGTSLNGSSSTNGIRVTYLLDNDVVSSMTASECYSEYITNGYLTVPANVNAVCVPVWDYSATTNEVYLFPAEETGTPTKPGDSSSGSTDTGGETVDNTGITWYVNHLNNKSHFTSTVNIAGRGWCHKEDTPAYNAYVGKTVNTIGFFSTNSTQSVTIMKLSSNTDSTGTVLATVTPTVVDSDTNFMTVSFPDTIINSGEYLGAFCQDDSNINFLYAAKAVTDANGIVDGNFYGRVPKVYGSGTAWTSYTDTSVCLGWSIGYKAS